MSGRRSPPPRKDAGMGAGIRVLRACQVGGIGQPEEGVDFTCERSRLRRTIRVNHANRQASREPAPAEEGRGAPGPIRFDGAAAVPSVRSAPAYSRIRSPTPSAKYSTVSLVPSSNSALCRR